VEKLLLTLKLVYLYEVAEAGFLDEVREFA